MHIKTLTVSQLNRYVKNTLDADFILNNASVKGEISNLKIHSSGHIYFSLKDGGSKINCVMFKSYAYNLKFALENGMDVVALGNVSVYEKEGSYQLYVKDMKREGIGDLYVAFEKLKEKLKEEGLFDDAHKKEIPKFSKKIGVITSPTGAAIKDIINVTKRRNKGIELLIYPALVQGTDASKTLIEGIKTLNKVEDVDIIILARGGGSIEELWAFNNEELAYAVYNSKKPIITGVGHETDFTIIDFVSDRRAPTPSAAAEIAAFDREVLINEILNYKYNIKNSMENIIKEKRNYLNLYKQKIEANSPTNIIANEYRNIDNLKELLNMKIEGKLNKEKNNLSRLSSLLEAHNPLNVLKKGYTLIEDEGNNLITEKEALKELNKINIIFKDGRAKLSIKYIEEF
ncbi:exodeoxyribonuclease VII large subunit [Clostridium botulinum]|uniref:Exodeoxyribonuclease 7 large subunit n=2 Tax=Clostridium botulinum TaxID=1491 RepID=EX7L_CLOBM|nr:exodeoxyribonuclease VII large subunit [Clostridium botulinum]B1KT53.1 RecName: Full=Exodeoxyribonuclease 7 large subunit; AltName: Full=Exodeoxyribonuclease VII large subunit; Short=Exonuclease VII large subunit [Clostridium botulinum A3 str. Loch Maree]ACA54518.1 exodeoxyribonuclease VII, large subunit [Clostridium botulinum A3 str. Loch Maree]NFH66295.1 exodeoxyribonuclease VII large subunit [Clostridium botulinum]NFJ08770.1 exodeoxyribonuclease VII large subunit [Clostridium botulinum]N